MFPMIKGPVVQDNHNPVMKTVLFIFLYWEKQRHTHQRFTHHRCFANPLKGFKGEREGNLCSELLNH